MVRRSRASQEEQIYLSIPANTPQSIDVPPALRSDAVMFQLSFIESRPGGRSARSRARSGEVWGGEL